MAYGTEEHTPFTWNTTALDGKTVVWISHDGEPLSIVSVHDPERGDSRRVDPSTGETVPLSETAGLTVFGTHRGNRPSFEDLRALAPEYAYLVDGIEQGRGVTTVNVTRRG